MKDNGSASLVELARVLDLPVPPAFGLLLTFDDGTGESPVSFVRVRADRPGQLGIRPPAIEVRTKTEPGALIEAATAAGWAPLPAALEL